MAVSVDRFLAIHLHLRYQELVTHKRVVAVVISIWLFSIFVALMVLWVPLDVSNVIEVIFVAVGLVLTTLFYTRIYLAVRRHKSQIQALQVQQAAVTEELSNFASLIKSAVGTFYVYLVFLFCYFPFFLWLVSVEVNGFSTPLKKLFLSSLTLIFLNSSLNPIIYCWKMRHIRHAIVDIPRNMSWLRNRASR